LEKAIATRPGVLRGLFCLYCERQTDTGYENTPFDVAMETLFHYDAQDRAIPLLISALQSDIPEFRHGGAMYLARMAAEAAPASAALVEALRDGNWHVFHTALTAIEGIGPAALPWLIAALDDPDMGFRYRVCEAIGGLGAAAESAVPHLLRLLDNDEYAVQRAAAEALARIGPASIPGLEQRAWDHKLIGEDAWNIARWALAQIEAVDPSQGIRRGTVPLRESNSLGRNTLRLGRHPVTD
jgi:HEAT repeat protein